MLNTSLATLTVLALTLGPAQAWSSSTTPGSCAGLTPAQVSAIDATVHKALDAKLAPGVSLGIAYRGQKLFRSYGYADLEQAAPVKGSTPFWVMSINKEFTAASILLLAERGRLSLDDPLSKFLPDFPRAQEVTIRQLLNHTSGLRDLLNQPADRRLPFEARMMADPDRSLEELVPFAAGMVPGPYEFEPGTAWRYSNSGYVVLGAVIEKASGMSWKDFFRQNFFEPLHLTHTAVDDFYEIVPGRAQGYLRTKAGIRNARPFPHNMAGTAGSLRSTAEDLLTWQIALSGGQVVSRDSLREMTTPGRVKDGRLATLARPPGPQNGDMLSYGMGFMLDLEPGRKTFGHIGNFPGYETVVESYPENGLTIVALTNASGGASTLVPQLADDILKGELSAADAKACRAEHR